MNNFRNFVENIENSRILHLRDICLRLFRKSNNDRSGANFDKEYQQVVQILDDAGNSKKANLILALLNSDNLEARDKWLRKAEDTVMYYNFYGWMDSTYGPCIEFKLNDIENQALNFYIFKKHRHIHDVLNNRRYGPYKGQVDEGDTIDLNLTLKFKSSINDAARSRFMGVEQYLFTNKFKLDGEQFNFNETISFHYWVNDGDKVRKAHGFAQIHVPENGIQEVLQQIVNNKLSSGEYTLEKHLTKSGANLVHHDLEYFSLLDWLFDKFNVEVL